MQGRLMWRVPFVILGLGLAASACATHRPTGPSPSPFPGARQPRSPEVALGVIVPMSSLSGVLATAVSMAGQRYTFGGADPSTGFDCSGLVWYAFLQNHVAVPRTTLDLFRVGREVDRARIAPGDLIFFSTTDSGPSHVGLALDGQTIVHAPSTGTSVRIERFDTPYWQSRLLGIRRIEIAGPSPGRPTAY
jgi:cell wall-associated NlpC family hydrolase